MSLADYVEGVAEGRRGTLVQRQKDRSVWRVEEGGRVWFAKRGLTPKRRREIRREAENARALEVVGIGANVLAAGRHDEAEWLVTSDAGRSFEVELWRTEFPRDDLLRDLAKFVRLLHGRGWTFPALMEEHVRAGPRGLVLIDAARLKRGRRSPGVAARSVDLAALLFSFGPPWLGWWLPSRSERVRLLRDASGIDDDELRKLCRRVDDRIHDLSRRTRWRHEHFHETHAFRDALTAAEGGVSIDVPPFEAVFARTGMQVVRTLPDRENRTLGRGPNGRPLFFVKVFPPTKNGFSPAMREIAAIDLFERSGILVNRVAAYAEDVDKGSMIAVKAAAGEPLDDLLRHGVSVAERRALAVQTARIWRRMRECGLRHRDAYPCHLFVARMGTVPASGTHGPGRYATVRGTVAPVPAVTSDTAKAHLTHSRTGPSDVKAGTVPDAGTVPNQRFELRLIDLTRAGRAPFPRERWFVKDAAALWHGLPKPPVTRTDAVRWLREYFRVDRLDARAKRFARRVAAKERRIAARQARKRSR